MSRIAIFALALCLLSACAVAESVHKKHHHHHKHHKQAPAPAPAAAGPAPAPAAGPAPAPAAGPAPAPAAKEEKKPLTHEQEIIAKMKALESQLSKKEAASPMGLKRAKLLVNGPLPADFSERFAQSVSAATGCDQSEVKVIEIKAVHKEASKDSFLQEAGVVEVVFEGPTKIVDAVESQAGDATSKLAAGPMHDFLVAKDESAKEEAPRTPVQEKGIDIDTEMPYGELEPFGREDTAQELTEQSIKESDEMVDQLERAEVAEEKRSVFRALTRLRGAAITSFDGVARSQTGNIDEYNKSHKWRKTHPLHHLADEESDISKWAFPDNADF